MFKKRCKHIWMDGWVTRGRFFWYKVFFCTKCRKHKRKILEDYRTIIMFFLISTVIAVVSIVIPIIGIISLLIGNISLGMKFMQVGFVAWMAVLIVVLYKR